MSTQDEPQSEWWVDTVSRRRDRTPLELGSPADPLEVTHGPGASENSASWGEQDLQAARV